MTVLGDYTSRGYDDSKIYQDNVNRGFFNAQTINTTSFIRSIGDNNLLQPPLIYDYNNDGLKEIIVSDDNTFRMYQGRTLQLVDTIISNDTIQDYSIYNFNNVPYLVSSYILGAPDYSTAIVHSYNGSEWIYHSSHTTGIVSTRIIFSCYEDTGFCIVVPEKVDSINAYSFRLNDTTNTISSKGVDTRDTANNGLCYSSIPDITTYNKDNNNIQEFYMSTGQINTIGGSSFKIRTHELAMNESGHLITSTEIKEISPDFNDGNTCADYEYYFTSPLITDVDLVEPLDVVIGINDNTKEFKMHSFKISGSTIDDYPELFQADGIIISNPVRANVFEAETDLIDKDFCVLGYTEGNGTDLLCASEQLPEPLGLGDSVEFKSVNGSNTFNLDTGTAQNIIHAVQHSTETFEGADLSEFLTPFGVYGLDYDNNIFVPLFGFSYTNGILSDGDIEGIGRKDLLYVQENALIYIDDQFTNSNAEINDYLINPCIDSTWKQNSTISVTISPTDIDGDKVQARAILYYNHPDANVTQDSNWSIFVNSGSDIQFTFNADTVISNSVLRLQARDFEHNASDGDIIDLVFAVNINGVEFGDCVTSVTGLAEEEPVTDPVAPSEENPYTNTDNVLKQTIDNIAVMAGVPTFIFILEVLFFIDLFVFALVLFYGGKLTQNINVLIAGIALFDFLALLICSFMGIITKAFMYTTIMVIGAIAFFFIARLYHKSAGGGGN